MFKRILAAIDGSEQSMNAADVAISLASKYGSELTVLHVVVPFTFNDERNHPGTGLEEEYRRRIQEQTGKWFEGIKRKAGENNVKVKTEWTETSGPVQYEITRYADEQKMELIVIGSKGRPGIERLYLGSVASAVLMYASCPVLVVR